MGISFPMDDEAWNELRRAERKDRWTTKLGYAITTAVAVGALVSAISGDLIKAIVLAALAVPAVIYTHRVPPLIEFHLDDDND